MLRLEMLPAAHGDCLWIEYGNGSEVHRILIDGGPAHAYPALRERILHLPAGERRFDLLVVTHIDADHIEGIIRLLLDAETLECSFDRIWFNGAPQLRNDLPDPAGEALGSLQGEFLSLLIGDYEQRTGRAVWNAGLPGPLVAVDRKARALPTAELPGGCRLTLLSPDHQRLLDLKDNWDKELVKARLVSGDETELRRRLEQSRNLRPLGDVLGEEEDPLLGPRAVAAEPGFADVLGGEPGEEATPGCDKSLANGSSIALLLDFPVDASEPRSPKTRLLLAGDAWPGVIADSLDRLVAPGKRLAVDALKLPHHGSIANVDDRLLARLACANYLISTSGAVFCHPHARAVELLLEKHAGRGRPKLYFNYRSPTTAPWSDPEDQAQRKYDASLPEGLSVSFV